MEEGLTAELTHLEGNWRRVVLADQGGHWGKVSTRGARGRNEK